ncbi:MAG: ABC transporter permease [Firmicutes bacterium]|nr:ABC transporter permease [Bacillota bacterium]MBV1728597.1 ABC transporter permease [Desulforudis sp.]MBU4533703.1 ABC transporter permease [Bacillota bacterium]MBU4554804.1 ABC transporter permease [Bacillota bacterium]MBV1735303.1 ABC transporter permease [Desulforudis sp.]
MSLLESVRLALEGIMASKLRSFLTTLGIVIGIAAVITVVAIGQGGRQLLIGEMENLGTNLFAVYVDWRETDTTGTEFQVRDVAVIKELVPEVQHLAPLSSAMDQIRGSTKQMIAQVIGTTADLGPVRNLKLADGRFLKPEDDAGGRRVAVIEEDFAREIFGRQEPLGQKIIIRNTSFLVVGVLTSETSMFSFGTGKTVYVPHRAWSEVFNSRQVNQLEGTAVSRELVPEAMQKTVTILERRHGAPDRYTSVSLDQQMEVAKRITGIMTLVVGAVAGISLFVGGIGVMNIMLVSVTERVREIGVRMAVGARRKDILAQFLIESVVLCLIGGAIGMMLGIGGAFLVAKIANWPPLVAPSTVIIAVLFSALVGVLSGLWPANKAAQLDPIEALRRE